MFTSKNNWKLLAAGLFMAFGRYPISWLLSSDRKIKKPVIPGFKRRGYVNCESGNTYYLETDGKEGAQTIVFLHGLNGSRLQWYYQRAYFKTNYHVVFIDLPGHGRSPRPTTMDISIMASDLGIILDYLDIKSPILYGHSLGGMVVMKYSSKINQLNLKAIIIQHSTFSNPFKTCQFPKTMLALEHPVLRPFMALVKKYPLFFTVLSMVNYLNGLSSVFYRYLLFSGEQTAAQLRFMARLAAINPPEVIAEGLLKTLKFDVTHELKNIKVPALIMTAEFDRVVRPGAGAFIASKVKNGLHLEVSSGHLSLMEHAVEVNIMVNDFLESPLLDQDSDQLS